jgi:hypothetical protein
VSFNWRQSSIEELKGEWNYLVLRSSFPNFFSTWEWIRAWRSIFGNGKDERIWALYRSGGLIGIAPLRLAGRSLSFIGTGFSDRLDFIIQKGQEESFFENFRNLLLEDNSWDVLDLQEVDSKSPTVLFWERYFSTLDFRILPQSKLPYLTLPSTWDELLKRFSKKRRDKIRYYPRLLDKSYSWRIEEVPDSQLQEGLAQFFRLHLSRFKRKLMPTPALLPSFRSFHLNLARELAGKGIVRLYLLYLNDKPSASLYGFEFQDRFCFYLSGQDERFHEYSLGYILQIHAIKKSTERGLKFFDFLRGLESYKLHWKPEINENVRILAHKGTLKSKISFNVRTMEHALTHYVKKRAGRI